MISIDSISKTYNNKNLDVLKGISLSIHKGEIFGIIGRSGAGKSTLLRMINALEKPSSGSISVDGLHINELRGAELRDARKNIGMIFQHFNLLNTQSVLDNIMLPIKKGGDVSPADLSEWLDELLEITGLKSKIHAYPSHLSGGEKQRVSIARALIRKPTILLCDEATSSLDPITTRDILQLLVKINRLYKITIIMITHEMNVIKSICDRVAVLHKGQIVEVSNVKEFKENPRSTLAKEFLHECHDNILVAAGG